MGTLGWEANDVPYNCFRFAEQQSTLVCGVDRSVSDFAESAGRLLVFQNQSR